MKEKAQKTESIKKNPEFYKLVDAQLAGTWRPRGYKEPSDNERGDRLAFTFPISGYSGHLPTWNRTSSQRTAPAPAGRVLPAVSDRNSAPCSSHASSLPRVSSSPSAQRSAPASPSFFTEGTRSAHLAYSASAPSLLPMQVSPTFSDGVSLKPVGFGGKSPTGVATNHTRQAFKELLQRSAIEPRRPWR